MDLQWVGFFGESLCHRSSANQTQKNFEERSGRTVDDYRYERLL